MFCNKQHLWCKIRANALKMQNLLVITVADPADYGKSVPNPPYRNFNAFALGAKYLLLDKFRISAILSREKYCLHRLF